MRQDSLSFVTAETLKGEIKGKSNKGLDMSAEKRENTGNWRPSHLRGSPV